MTSYFIRWRGRVTGPYSEEEIRKDLRSGKLSKHHQISTDRKHWSALRDANEFEIAPEVMGQVIKLKGSPEASGNRPYYAVEPSGVIKLKNRPESAQEQPESAELTPNAESSAAEPGRLFFRWFYYDANAVCGPITDQQLKAWIQEGRVNGETAVCREGEESWKKLHDIYPDLVSQARQAPPAMERGFGGQDPQDIVTHAGFGARFAAMSIDSLILFVFMLVAGVIVFAYPAMKGRLDLDGKLLGDLSLVLQLFSAGFSWLYFAFFESSARQATPGKIAMGLIVTDLRGQRVSFGRATGRYFGKYLSTLLLYVGYFMAAFTERKQALHDLMAGALVLKRTRSWRLT